MAKSTSRATKPRAKKASAAAQPATKHTTNPLHLPKQAAAEPERPEVIVFVKLQGIQAQNIVEFGCGSGLFGSKLKETLAATGYIGIEPSENLAQIAQTRLDKVHIAELATSPDALGLAPGQYDLLVALDVLENLINPWDALATWTDLLRPGGHVLVSIPNTQNLQLIVNLVHGRWEYARSGPLDVAHLRFFTQQGINQLLNGAGLKIIRTQSVITQPFDVSKVRETGNTAKVQNLTLTDLTRAELIRLVTVQYMVLAQKPPAASEDGKGQG